MRLKTEDKGAIIELARLYFKDDFKLYLFGSRTDNNKKGGDIDLFIESTIDISLEAQLDFLTAIEKNVTQRKIDLIVKTPFKQDKAIFKTAKEQGILLC